MNKEKEICDLYLDGKSFTEIKVLIGIGQTLARKILVLNGIAIRGRSASRKKRKSHGLDVEYFKNIDSKEKAYWLGVIVSDGTIQKDGYKTSLASKDKDLIEKFKIAIKSEHTISKIEQFDKRTKKTYKRYMIQISSKEFTTNIINLGVTNRKSYVCEFPNIEEKYYLSFLRGLFDGDGSLGFETENSIRMSFTATKEIINHIQIFLEKKHKIKPHPIYVTSENMNVNRTHYFSDTKKILDLLYADSTEESRLNRKYNIYEKYNKKLNSDI